MYSSSNIINNISSSTTISISSIISSTIRSIISSIFSISSSTISSISNSITCIISSIIISTTSIALSAVVLAAVSADSLTVYNYYSLSPVHPPGSLQHDVCQTTTLSTPSGYLLSPSYPRQYTTTARQCAATVTVPIGQRIRFTLLDLYLAYYRQDREIKCLDKLWISDGVEISDVFCSGQQRGLVFTSRANQATVYFESSDHKFRNAKGFWLYYEG